MPPTALEDRLVDFFVLTVLVKLAMLYHGAWDLPAMSHAQKFLLTVATPK